MTPERFWSRVDKQPDGCWLWTGATRSNGYGNVAVLVDGRKTSTTAHRVAYEMEVGPIPEGLVIDHLCRVVACVRPDHLEAVTSEENLRRGNRRGRKRKGYVQEVGPDAFRIYIDLPREEATPRRRITETIRGSRADAEQRVAEYLAVYWAA